MISFQKAFSNKIAVAGHGTRYLFRLTFSRIISIFAILPSQCLFAKHIEKKTHITQTIVCRLIVSVLQTNSVFSRFLLLSSSSNSKLSVNPSWVKWCIFKTSPKSHSLERAQEVNFSPSGAVRDKNPLWACAVIFVSSAHARPDVRHFVTSGNGCFQSPSFPNHVTKKRRALGKRKLKVWMKRAIHARALLSTEASKSCSHDIVVLALKPEDL